jgi:DNA-binding GntR family transcriptional regulator
VLSGEGMLVMEDKLKVNLNEYLPLRDVVFNTLREAILKGELIAGERLMEKQLAERMGVSRTPIREAIRKLELEGLVVMIPRKGAEVARITHKDIKDVLEVRAALEELAVKIACNKITDEDLTKLKRTTEEFQIACNYKDIDDIIKKDVEFHDIIFNSTENEKLIQIINNLREQIYRYRVEYIRKLNDFDMLVKEHDQIVKHVEARDADEARKIALQHIVNQEKAVIEIFDKKNK